MNEIDEDDEDAIIKEQYRIVLMQMELYLTQKKLLQKQISLYREKDALKKGHKSIGSHSYFEQDRFIEAVHILQNEYSFLQKYKDFLDKEIQSNLDK
jgi:predicted XRE-type DNA-binding protein